MASTEHNDLCLKAVKFLKNNGFAVSFDDRFQAATGTGELPDAIGFRNGVSVVIEVKVSRSDFLADKKSISGKRLNQAWEIGVSFYVLLNS